MKQFATIAALLLAAPLCLAQSDSDTAKPDSVKVSVEVQNTGSDDASVTVTTEKGTTDSTVTVSINSGRQTGKRPPRRRQWVLGCRMASLEFKNFPGTVFLQHRAGRLGFAGLGFRYTNDPSGPAESYSQHDSSISKNSSRNWTVGVFPEYAFTRAAGSWVGSVTVRGIFEYAKWTSSGDGRTIGEYYSSTNHSESKSDNRRYGVEVPVAVERRFRIGRMVLSAGLAGQFIAASASRNTSEDSQTSTYTTSGGTTTYSWRNHGSYNEPLHFTINSPFNGSASIQLKYWF